MLILVIIFVDWSRKASPIYSFTVFTFWTDFENFLSQIFVVDSLLPIRLKIIEKKARLSILQKEDQSMFEIAAFIGAGYSMTVN